MTSGNELERTLRATLAARANTIENGPAWNGPETSSQTASDPGVAQMTPSRRAGPSRRWRTPLLSAAAVVAVAVVTSAIVTGGFSGGTDPASGGAAGMAPVTVPIACQFTVVGNASGSAVGHDAGSSSATQTGHSPTSSPDGCASPGSVHMAFVGGTPPQAGLSWTLSLSGNKASAPSGHETSAGTPPSYLSVGGGLPEGSRYLWGAVGPDVTEIQIQALLPPNPGDIDPGFSPNSAFWTIGSGAGTNFSLPGQDNVLWTDLGNGWHGFAIQPPTDTKQVDITMLGPDGQALQTRRFQFIEGVRDWSELPPQTPAATTGPAPQSVVTSDVASSSPTTQPTAAPASRTPATR